MAERKNADRGLVDAWTTNPGGPRPDGRSPRERDASVTSTHGVPHHGYKGHIAADRSGLVTDDRFGTAKEHDSNRVDDLTLNETKPVLADSAYSSAERRAERRARGGIDGIIYRRYRGRKRLYDWQERRNRLVARHRARVEHPTAMLRHQLGYRRVRHRGRERSAFDFALMLAACNIKGGRSLKAAGAAVAAGAVVAWEPWAIV